MNHSDQPPPTVGHMARVRELFHLALQSGLVGPEREQWLTRHCADDPVILSHLRELLEADAAADAATRWSNDSGGLLGVADDPRDQPAHTGDPVPATLGRYTVGPLLGRGGMGAVYLATQTNPDRQVALKVLRTRGSSSSLRARFDREIRALGRLEHPAIARIYDAGQDTAAEGEFTFFAMELVRGPNLIDFAQNRRLGLAERVALLARVADGVQHAHARGVLHRDLKPANVLVTDDAPPPSSEPLTQPRTAASAADAPERGPLPKVLDFGVARMIEPDTSHTTLTHHGLLVGTVAYMSPEQLSGDPDAVDTRSDIYALGVMLHELITGSLPFDVAGKPLAEAARTISHGEPAPIRTHPGIRNARIDHDLVTIVRKAMARDKESRYASAGELADDLRRHLHNQPITARPPTALYHLTRFARRNKPLALSAVATLLAVIVGLVVSSTLYFREQRAAREAQRQSALSNAVREYLIKDLLMAASPKRQGWEVRMLDVLTGAASGLSDRFKDYPEIEAEVRMDLAAAFNDLGKPADSLLNAARARELLRTLAGPDADRTIQAVIRMAQAQSLQHDAPAALTLASDAVERADRALPPGHTTRAWAHGVLGAALLQSGRASDAIAPLRSAIAIWDTSDASVPEAIATRTWLASALLQTGDTDASLDLSRQLLTQLEQAGGPATPEALAARNNLINVLLAAQRWAEAADVAGPLPDLLVRTFPPGDQSIIFGCLTAAAAMLRVERFADAERLALQTHQLAVTGFDDLHWFTEQATTALRHICARWPDRRENLWSWQQQGLRIRLMVATPDEREATANLLGEVLTLQRQAGQELTGPDVVRRLWELRDQIAPQGHGRRAVFFANLAALAAEQPLPSIAAEALDFARQSAPSAADPAAAQASIRAAQAAVHTGR